MPPPDQEEERQTMTIPMLAVRVKRSRTLIHRLASNPAEGWPAPTYRPGSTRAEYDVAWFDGYWAERQKSIRQGKRTDLDPKGPEVKTGEEQQGEKPTKG